jgi:putative hydrolase of HD superfamily
VRDADLDGVLEFLRHAERLKSVQRSAWTSEGVRESVAEHTWRLCLMALVLSGELDGIDAARVIEMCIVHDLGEAIGGDVPAVDQDPSSPKASSERRDLLTLLEPLPASLRDRVVALWDEYEAAETPEARVAKALDKLETIMQHNQGLNPPGFDYVFNLGYGARFTGVHPVIARMRAMLDAETEAHARRGAAPREPNDA